MEVTTDDFDCWLPDLPSLAYLDQELHLWKVGLRTSHVLNAVLYSLHAQYLSMLSFSSALLMALSCNCSAVSLFWNECKWMSQPADTVQQALLMCRKNSYPNTYRVLECLAVLPVTSTEGERSFTQLRRLKTFLRATMGGGGAPGRASFDAVPQATGDPARPGLTSLQVCKASATAHDPGEHLSGLGAWGYVDILSIESVFH